MAVNYVLAGEIHRAADARKTILTVLGVTLNLAPLGYLEYFEFFVEQLSRVGGGFDVPAILLPIGISFYTFQQAAYLVDAYRDRKIAHDFVQYTVFVTFSRS